MSKVFFDELEIPLPDVNLGAGSGLHGEQTARMLEGLEKYFIDSKPDWVLTYGDTNSTLAAALAASKLKIPMAHVEAGLRSFNKSMPEEINRIITDHCSDLLLAPTTTAMAQLSSEGLAENSVLVGDVMVDSLLFVLKTLESPFNGIGPELKFPKDFILATIHRAENTDSKERLQSIVAALSSSSIPVVIPAHPRLTNRCSSFGIELTTGNLHSINPLSYRNLIQTVQNARSIITDSGGLQKEAFLLDKPCTTIRGETEWIETLEDGWNILLPDLDGLIDVALRQAPSKEKSQPYGDGTASEKIVNALTSLN